MISKMRKNRLLIFLGLLLVCGVFSRTSLSAKNSASYYKAKENVYFLMGDFVNEWANTDFNPTDEKWKKEGVSLPPLLSKDEIKSLLEIEKHGSVISSSSSNNNSMICVDYAPFDGNIYVFYGISFEKSDTKTLIVYADEKDDKIFAMTSVGGSPYAFVGGFSLPEEYQKKWSQLISTLKKRFEEYKKNEQNIKDK